MVCIDDSRVNLNNYSIVLEKNSNQVLKILSIYYIILVSLFRNNIVVLTGSPFYHINYLKQRLKLIPIIHIFFFVSSKSSVFLFNYYIAGGQLSYLVNTVYDKYNDIMYIL